MVLAFSGLLVGVWICICTNVSSMRYGLSWWSFGNSLTLPLSQPLWDGYSTCGYTQGDCCQVKYKHFTFAFCSSLFIVLCCQSIGNSSNIFSQRQNNTSIWMLTTSRNYLIVMIQIIVDQNSSPDVSVLGGRLKMMWNLLRVCYHLASFSCCKFWTSASLKTNQLSN